MSKELVITYKGMSERRLPAGITLKEISKYYKNDFYNDILIAKVDNDIVELGGVINRNCNIEFYDRSTTLGRCVYISSISFMLILAIKRILGDEAEVSILHSIDNAIFCEVRNATLTRNALKKIEDEMYTISRSDYKFEKVSVSRSDAMKYFKSHKQMDKVNVLKYISNTYINLYSLEGLYDYFHNKLAYSTSQVNSFKLTYIKGNSFVMAIPTLLNPECTLDYCHHEKVADSFDRLQLMGEKMGIQHASDLNRLISDAKATDIIQESESYYDNELQRCADEILKRDNIKLILLAGPSSSGKTTTSKRLRNYIKARGMDVMQISVDNYFVDREKNPKDKDGNYDFESLYAVDLELFNRHLLDLMDGKVVDMPIFNFVTGKREYKNNLVQLKKNQVMIVEGIHALNEKLTMSVEKKYKFKIYIAPLAHLSIDEHNHIQTTDIRKFRRIVRDCRTRGHNALATLNMWSSIRKGEERNIYPFQDEADMVINSSLIYEIGVLKTYVEPLLFCVNEQDDVYPEALRLINLLRNFLPIPSDDVPIDSVLREFIGGSCFKDE